MRTFLDGEQWCCTDWNFVNLQESPAGFGDTGIDAFLQYCKITKTNMFAAFDGNDLLSFDKSEHRLKSELANGYIIVYGCY